MGAKVKGRPTKLTPELIGKAEELLRNGNYEKTTARALGITPGTWCNWKNLGKEGKPLFSEFLQRITRALTEAEAQAVDCVRKAMYDDWRAAAFYLERRYHKRWGKVRFEHTGKDGKDLPPAKSTNVNVTVNLDLLSDDERRTYRELCAKLAGRSAGGIPQN